MKKITAEKKQRFRRKEIACYRREKRKAGQRKRRRYFFKKKLYTRANEDNSEQFHRHLKRKFQKEFYKPIKYKHPKKNITIYNHFGLEHDFDSFLNISATFIESQSKKLSFDLGECERMWPSSIVLLCSLIQWVKMTAKPNLEPDISSSKPKSKDVASYLAHCGFYDYVGRRKDITDETVYRNEEIVKIERETDSSVIEKKEEEIITILKKYSALNDEQIEEFNCTVLTEAFNNVSEHGVRSNYYKDGWWTLTQVHQNTGIISLCIADNGIGIKNSLKTGPQKEALAKVIGNDSDGDYLKHSLKENISGALTASTKDQTSSYLRKKSFSRGSRRGNGLNRIKEACKNCNVQFTLISQKGFLRIKPSGNIDQNGTKSKKVFAGTLYHFTIPVKKEEMK